MPSPRSAREVPQRYRLEASQCSGCKRRYFPPRQICPSCRGTSFETVRLAREGKIVTWTVVYNAPEAFESLVPYALGIVELDDGVRLTAPLVDCDPEELQIGARVRSTFRRLSREGKDGIIHYGHKFTLVR